MLTMAAETPPFAARTVRCPGCGGPSRYAIDNAQRPFCSVRCRNGDLSAWANEGYRVEARPPAPDGVIEVDDTP